MLELSVSQLRACLSAENAKDVSWSWLSPFQKSGSLTIEFLSKFRYI